MPPNYQALFDSDNSDAFALREFVALLLAQYGLEHCYCVEEIITEALTRNAELVESDAVLEIQLAWLKTICLEVIKDYSRQHCRQRFDRAMQALFDDNNPDAHTFFAGVARMLRQFRLNGTYDVRDIINEAYARGIVYIESGKGIDTPIAWLRGTCLNVIREFRRQQDKSKHPRISDENLDVLLHKQSTLHRVAPDDLFSTLVLEEDMQMIHQAIQQLNPLDRQILCLRYWECQSWQEIGESLSEEGADSLSANAARQRGYRALQRLRELYLAVQG
ncbi:RNA polymerase sigma factor [Leptolyngbya sp. AN02str]|uniref:RNA polymerase sigma factor n=1 Tax=Leptolyngbya sp. AN02str TaxID=3423363 RepID=UPI003D31FFAC